MDLLRLQRGVLSLRSLPRPPGNHRLEVLPMKRLTRLKALVFLPILLPIASQKLPVSTPADSQRGARLFESLQCVNCHSINGKGGKIAPDLSRERSFTPPALAATMWNHAPAMWGAMRERNVPMPQLDAQGAADLFAYFYSVRFFEQPGDAGRGKALFSAKHCAVCHQLPNTKFDAIGHPIELVNAMWNHAGPMRAQFEQKKLKWEELTAQDLADLLVYLRNRPEERDRQPRVLISAGANGAALFDSKA